MAIQIQIATVNTCNAACHFCTYPTPENTYPRGVMDMDLFRKIIDDAATIPLMNDVCFSALGEPLLDRFLVERVRYTRQARPDWDIELYTNGTALTPAKFDTLKEAGVSVISISLNAVNPKQHEDVMGLKGLFGKVVSNARYACDHADGMQVLVKAVRDDKHFKEPEHVQFLQTWGNRLKPWLTNGEDHGIVVTQGNWAGDVEFIEARKKDFDPNSCCARALTQFNVLWDGVVSACCFDPQGKLKFGDLKTQTIRDIYNSEAYLRFRETHVENRAAEYSICATCTRI